MPPPIDLQTPVTSSKLNSRHWDARLQFSIAGVNDLLRVVHFSAQEAISSLYEYRINIACENPALSLNDLIGRQASFQIKDDHGRQRTIHGAIYAVTQETVGQRFAFYTFSLVPHFKWLQHRRGFRIYQNLDVPAIVRQIFETAGLDSQSYRVDLKDQYSQREFCIQYDESEWDFVSRLLEEEGIHFHFEQSERQPVMVIADHPAAFRPLEPQRNIKFQASSGQVGDESTLHSFSARHQVGYDQVTLNDYNYEKPRHSLITSAQHGRAPSLEQYDFPGRYKNTEEGGRLSRIGLARAKIARDIMEAKGSVNLINSGAVFSMTQHPRDELNDDYLITGLRLSGQQPQVLEEQSGSGSYQFESVVSCIPATTEYRPPLNTVRPTIQGSQTAVVYGPPGETIYTDSMGRIKVNFHWDREQQNSCWLRVSQTWAGNQWGAMTLPRVGQEVLVHFVEGDPDRPIVTGCVYHRLHKPPYPLPTHKTRTSFKSQSVPSGGSNELRIEDKKGQEQIFIQAQKDLDIKALENHKTHVGADSHYLVESDLFDHVKGDINQQAGSDIKIKSEGGHHTTLGGDRQIKVAGDIEQQAGNEVHIKAGGHVILDAGVELTIKAGGAFIKLNPAGVQVQGATINLNGGGSASNASTASPKAPAQAIAVAQERTGQALKQPTTKAHYLVPKVELGRTPASPDFAANGSTLYRRAASSNKPVSTQAGANGNVTGVVSNTATATEQPEGHLATANIIDSTTGAAQPTISYEMVAESDINFTSTLAHDQLVDFANDVNEVLFIRTLINCFGTDIPAEAYRKLYNQLRSGALASPDIVVHEGSSVGAAYNRNERKIFISEQFIKQAVTSDKARVQLVAALIEEYGHYIDEQLRTQLSHIGGDAEQDEGAKFAYQLINLRLDEQSTLLVGQVASPSYTGDMAVHFGELYNQAKQAVSVPHQLDDDVFGEWEFFGAGMGNVNDPRSYGHQKIELVLQQVDFSRKDLSRVYFGNWLRDLSQIIDPQIIRPAKAQIPMVYQQRAKQQAGPLLDLIGAGLSRQALTKLVALFAAKEFGDEYGKEAYTLLSGPKGPQILGVYRPEEHIDNPLPAGKREEWVDASTIDPDFAPPPTELQLALNPTTGLKNYIGTATKGQSFPTAKDYMSAQLTKAMAAGKTDEGLRYFGQALHVLEDFFSHSNFVELALIKMGYPVYPGVEVDKSIKRIPLVTGRFGRYDVLASIGPKFAELFPVTYEEYEQQNAGDRSLTEGAILIVLEDLAAAQSLNPSTKNGKSQIAGRDYAYWLDQYKHFLNLRDILRSKQDNVVAQFALKTMHNMSYLFALVANFSIHHLLNTLSHSIDDVQTLVDATGTNPTHSQLAKDHDHHHFHEIAALLAREAVRDIGRHMKGFWDRNPTARPVDKASLYIAHPLDSKWYEDTLASWASNNPHKIQRGYHASSIGHVTEKANNNLDELSAWIIQQEQAFNKAYQIIEKLVDGDTK
ncbi:type VI secretion system tip protein TssI/VgrG [Alkalimarinus coralli]|uniref:type VI secretion system tip protein TssI/VgrG n=1 Tax=Alkalimarinus coralli TaxID=2935863 RepID=UPI00202B85DF|nr:type VI secretion system tip protein TssI/VgrG [Alkalimarinus coralli]